MKKFQKGFAVLETLLIILIVAIIGGTGYYIWHSKRQTDKLLDNASAQKISAAKSTKKQSITATSKNKVSASTEDTANWLVYKSPDNSYSIKVADGWKLVKISADNTSLVGFSADDITYKKGIKGEVSVQPGGRDGAIPFSLNVVGRNGFNQPNISGTKQIGFKTNQGVEVNKYVYTQTTPPDGPGLSQGGTQYSYVVTNGSATIQIWHDENPGDPNNVDIVELVIKTLEI